MIKKFVSKALLSVFMDKQARQKLEASRGPKNAKSSDRNFTPSDEDTPAPQLPDPVPSMSQDEITALIRDSLDAAEQEITEKKVKRAANPDRQALIEQAMAIHGSKKHIVDELPEEQRQKLIFMAQQALGAQLKDKK